MINEQRSAVPLGDGRQLAFYLVVIGALGFFGVMLREMLPLVVTAWFVDVGSHRLHDLNFFALVWLGIVGLASQLYRPNERVNAVIVPVLVMGPLAVVAVTTGSPIAMLPIIFTVVGLVVATLHPAGRSLVRFDRVETVDRRLVALLVVPAAPLLAYAGDQLLKQYTVADEHAALVHYGAMALLAVFILLMGSLSTVRRRDWRFAAWSAGVLAVYLGASSAAFPAMASSVGLLWGGFAVAWGLVFVGAVEASRRTDRTGPREG